MSWLQRGRETPGSVTKGRSFSSNCQGHRGKTGAHVWQVTAGGTAPEAEGLGILRSAAGLGIKRGTTPDENGKTTTNKIVFELQLKMGSPSPHPSSWKNKFLQVTYPPLNPQYSPWLQERVRNLRVTEPAYLSNRLSPSEEMSTPARPVSLFPHFSLVAPAPITVPST